MVELEGEFNCIFVGVSGYFRLFCGEVFIGVAVFLLGRDSWVVIRGNWF